MLVKLSFMDILFLCYFFFFKEIENKENFKRIKEATVNNNKEDMSYKPPDRIEISNPSTEIQTKQNADSDEMVKKEIQDLLNDEEKTFSYTGTTFLILIFVLLVIRVLTN